MAFKCTRMFCESSKWRSLLRSANLFSRSCLSLNCLAKKTDITPLPGFYNMQLSRMHTSPQNNPDSPFLTEAPLVVWPNVFKFIRNRFLMAYVINQQFDPDFTMHEFIRGSKKAVEVISVSLSKGTLHEIEEFMTPELYKTISKNVRGFSLRQQMQLAVYEPEIYLCFPFDISLIVEADENVQRKFMEIIVCYHSYHGLDKLDEKIVPFNVGFLPEHQSKLQVLNYTFKRECTPNVDSDWIITSLNHFKPSTLP